MSTTLMEIFSNPLFASYRTQFMHAMLQLLIQFKLENVLNFVT